LSRHKRRNRDDTHTHTHTHQTSCSTWTTELLSKKPCSKRHLHIW